ncbi:hypothetical protein ATCC90586_003314 [Pythium insidiosum]|nr:hypothetical protein ATCC90586_003314 [Pythium insidiosum]
MGMAAIMKRPDHHARGEASLRLKLLVGICVALSALLGAALTLCRPANRLLWQASAPVFIADMEDAETFKAAVDGARVRRVDLVQGGEGKQTSRASVSIVETLPLGDFNLSSSVPSTHTVLLERTRAATRTIDISAMYWNLLGKDDRKVYSDAEMLRFGADRGRELFDALRDAAGRGVTLRIITAAESVGERFSDGNGSLFSALRLPEELETLRSAFPNRVRVHTWSGTEWYGGGILHQKIWIFDRSHVYVGSANMDWKSLAQVMEVGVMLQDLAPAPSEPQGRAPVLKQE